MIWNSQGGTYKTLNHYQQGGTGSPSSGFVRSYYDNFNFWKTEPDKNGDIAYLPFLMYLGDSPEFVKPYGTTSFSYLKSNLNTSYNNNLVLNKYNIDNNEQKFYYCMWMFKDEPLNIFELPTDDDKIITEYFTGSRIQYALLPYVNRYVLMCQVPYNNTDEPYFSFMENAEKETQNVTVPNLSKFNNETLTSYLDAKSAGDKILNYLMSLNLKIDNFYLKQKDIKLNLEAVSFNNSASNTLQGYNEYNNTKNITELLAETKKDISFNVNNMAWGYYDGPVNDDNYITGPTTITTNKTQSGYLREESPIFYNKLFDLEIYRPDNSGLNRGLNLIKSNIFTPPNTSGYIVITQLVRLSKLTRSETKIKIF